MTSRMVFCNFRCEIYGIVLLSRNFHEEQLHLCVSEKASCSPLKESLEKMQIWKETEKRQKMGLVENTPSGWALDRTRFSEIWEIRKTIWYKLCAKTLRIWWCNNFARNQKNSRGSQAGQKNKQSNKASLRSGTAGQYSIENSFEKRIGWVLNEYKALSETLVFKRSYSRCIIIVQKRDCGQLKTHASFKKIVLFEI